MVALGGCVFIVLELKDSEKRLGYKNDEYILKLIILNWTVLDLFLSKESF